LNGLFRRRSIPERLSFVGVGRIIVARDRRIAPPGKRFEDSRYRPAHLFFMPISIHPELVRRVLLNGRRLLCPIINAKKIPKLEK
jgi:hypothetical protein